MNSIPIKYLPKAVDYLSLQPVGTFKSNRYNLFVQEDGKAKYPFNQVHHNYDVQEVKVIPETLWFFVLEGAKIDETKTQILIQPNTPNEYNDILVLFDKEEIKGIYIVSSNPGKFWAEKLKKTNKPVANIVKGIWPFYKAIHKTYPALRGKDIRVWRDWDADFSQDFEDIIDIGEGIDVHAGGTDIKKVDDWSAGCTVFYGGKAKGSSWDNFQKIIYDSKQQWFTGVWWSAQDMLRWVGSEIKQLQNYTIGLDLIKAPLLQLGNGGTSEWMRFWVILLQECLNQPKMSINSNTFDVNLKLDGDFGKQTRDAICQFQKTFSLSEYGLCGQETWSKLYELI